MTYRFRTLFARPAAGAFLIALLVSGPVSAALLWEIGTADDDTREFALAPAGHREYKHDGVFLVGRSKPERDWPYAHPGPADAWSGGRKHTFTVFFGIDSPPSSGTCRLRFDLVDTHNRVPPELSIDLNGRTERRRLPAGASDASIDGDPSKGKAYAFTVDFPATLLKRGANRIAVTSESGSWFLYDWLGFEAPAGVGLADVPPVVLRSIATPQVLIRKEGKLCQPVNITVLNTGKDTKAAVRVAGVDAVVRTLAEGNSTIGILHPAVTERTSVDVTVEIGGALLADERLELRPVRKWEIYLLHHSHVDIGYTHVQDEVERLQWDHLERSVELGEKTAGYPEEARYKWNSEVLWAVDSYIRNADGKKKARFIEAVRKGVIGLDALYANELTALCGEEEIMRLFDSANRLSGLTGVPIDAAMITDVPGYTWGLIAAMGHNGVKYFSIGPNSGHRIGTIYEAWRDRPFWWVSPSGRHKVLCWIAGKGYSWFHTGLNYTEIKRSLNEDQMFGYLDELEKSNFPYDIVHVRYNIGSDNGPPDPGLPDAVREWNEKYEYPKLRIASTSEMFRAFEDRYGGEIPSVSGDFTPYWEDGAASSALETAMNRAAGERLVQAEILRSLTDPAGTPGEAFDRAWRDVLLYDEHTWGSWNSISDPENDFTKRQWRIKRSYAVEADSLSRELLDDALGSPAAAPSPAGSIDIVNTSSWPRTDLVTLPAGMKRAGDVVKRDGRTIPSQVLSTGELAFIAENIPPLGSRRFTIERGTPSAVGSARAEGSSITNGILTASVDPVTGAVTSLTGAGGSRNLVDTGRRAGLNDYLYVAGRDPASPLTGGPCLVTVTDPGPLVVAIRIESEAPGARKLVREIRMIDGIGRLDIATTVDKENIYDQEGVHIAFPFDIPGGVVRMDVPWATVRAETDQLPGANRNYYTVQRWIDISNQARGVTLAAVDAPLFEIGDITADPVATGWLRRVKPGATVYSYVMNNYWETNYKASQEGPVTFRYSLMPHGIFNDAAAYRFGVERCRPLIVRPSEGGEFDLTPPVRVNHETVVATAMKPLGGHSVLVRLYNTGAAPQTVTLGRTERTAAVHRATASGRPLGRVAGPLGMLPHEIVNLLVTVK